MSASQDCFKTAAPLRPEIIDTLVDEFAVDAATAQAEMERVIEHLRARGLVV
jgi:hypothetical protein